MSVVPAVDAEPASWLIGTGVDWMDLVRYGPPGFEAYVRIGLTGEPAPDSLRAALATLAGHTTTPEIGYAAIWEGWTTGPVPGAPVVRIPNRTMVLFTGPVAVLRDAPAMAWFGASAGRNQERTSSGRRTAPGAWPARSTRRSSSPWGARTRWRRR